VGALAAAVPEGRRRRAVAVILATVGTTELPFDRLVRAVDDLASRAKEPVLIQIGHSTYEPRHAQWFRFDTAERMRALITLADVVVTHGGFAIISDCLRANKRIVACPRLGELGEAVNPQRELAAYLAGQGLLVAVDDIVDLPLAIERARSMPLGPSLATSTW